LIRSNNPVFYNVLGAKIQVLSESVNRWQFKKAEAKAEAKAQKFISIVYSKYILQVH